MGSETPYVLEIPSESAGHVPVPGVPETGVTFTVYAMLTFDPLTVPAAVRGNVVMVGIPLDAFTVLENIIKVIGLLALQLYPAARAAAVMPTGVTVIVPVVVEVEADVGWPTMVWSKDKMVSLSYPVLTLLITTPSGAPGML